jgi:hypothetical protein
VVDVPEDASLEHVLAIKPEPAQFTPPVCSCCKCQPSIYRTYGDGTVLCVECAG